MRRSPVRVRSRAILFLDDLGRFFFQFGLVGGTRYEGNYRRDRDRDRRGIRHVCCRTRHARVYTTTTTTAATTKLVDTVEKHDSTSAITDGGHTCPTVGNHSDRLPPTNHNLSGSSTLVITSVATVLYNQFYSLAVHSLLANCSLLAVSLLAMSSQYRNMSLRLTPEDSYSTVRYRRESHLQRKTDYRGELQRRRRAEGELQRRGEDSYVQKRA